MVLNYIWIAFFLIAFVIALIKLVVFGDTEVFPTIMNSTFETSKTAFEISLGLTGMLALWLGIMKIGERGGVVNILARLLSPVFTKLFPDVPKGHPATGSIFMNIAANMLGLDNAATPLGLKAMEQLQAINNDKIEQLKAEKGIDDEEATRLRQTATNPMIMFLVLNTSGLTLIPVSIMAYRAQQGAAQPTDVFVPILLATFFATLAGVIITSFYQRINMLNRTMLLTLGGMSVVVAAIIWGFSRMDSVLMNTVSISSASILLMTIIVGFIAAAMRKRVNVYDTFVEGAKEGFTTAVRIIPYLVAILVAIGVAPAIPSLQDVIGEISCKVKIRLVANQTVGAYQLAREPHLVVIDVENAGDVGPTLLLCARHGKGTALLIACGIRRQTVGAPVIGEIINKQLQLAPVFRRLFIIERRIDALHLLQSFQKRAMRLDGSRIRPYIRRSTHLTSLGVIHIGHIQVVVSALHGLLPCSVDDGH